MQSHAPGRWFGTLAALLAMFGCAALQAQNAPAGAGNAASPFQASEFSVQIDGIVNARQGGSYRHTATNSAGILIGYRVHLSHWEAVEIEYGYNRNGQNFYAPPGVTAYRVQAAMHELVVNEVVNTPRLFGVFQPFLLAGGGFVDFRPYGAPSVVASPQARAAFNWGFGADFHIIHLGARLEYQGLVYKVPNFDDALLDVNRWSQISQPSLGLIFTW